VLPITVTITDSYIFLRTHALGIDHKAPNSLDIDPRLVCDLLYRLTGRQSFREQNQNSSTRSDMVVTDDERECISD